MQQMQVVTSVKSVESLKSMKSVTILEICGIRRRRAGGGWSQGALVRPDNDRHEGLVGWRYSSYNRVADLP